MSEETQNSQPSTGASEGSAKSVSGGSAKVFQSKRAGLVGIKAGMTQVFDAEGSSFAVTVIQVRPNVVTAVRTPEKNGYDAIQVATLPKVESRVSKAERGHFKAVGEPGFYNVQEFRLPAGEKASAFAVGDTLAVDTFKAGELVDLTAMSKGKGFQGGMKRYHMAGGFKTHGASVTHRHTGSIGNRADPGKCFKNKKMAGNMGHLRVTVQNVKVVRVDAEQGLILVNGSVPGPKTGFVMVRRAVKT